MDNYHKLRHDKFNQQLVSVRWPVLQVPISPSIVHAGRVA
jgi:hypothetical protein